mgnify:CR=1 FL=1
MKTPEQMREELEQKLKISYGNIIAVVTLSVSIFGGFVNIKATQAEDRQRITSLEKSKDEMQTNYEKVNLKLDKIMETVSQIRLESANQRVKDLENKLK